MTVNAIQNCSKCQHWNSNFLGTSTSGSVCLLRLQSLRTRRMLLLSVYDRLILKIHRKDFQIVLLIPTFCSSFGFKNRNNESRASIWFSIIFKLGRDPHHRNSLALVAKMSLQQIVSFGLWHHVRVRKKQFGVWKEGWTCKCWRAWYNASMDPIWYVRSTLSFSFINTRFFGKVHFQHTDDYEMLPSKVLVAIDRE